MPNKLTTTLIFCLLGGQLYAQRSQSVEIKGGFYTNFGVAYYNHFDPDSGRHNFEWDQHFNAEFLGVSWRIPLNVYTEVGITYHRSIAGQSEIIQAEYVFYDKGELPLDNPQPLYAGTTVLKSSLQEMFVDMRINHLIRSRKVQVHFDFNFGFVIAENHQNRQNAFQAVNEDLLTDLRHTYVVRDIRRTFGFGFGLQYPMKNGLKIELIDCRGRIVVDWEDSEVLISKYGMAFSTGISYQFKKKI